MSSTKNEMFPRSPFSRLSPRGNLICSYQYVLSFVLNGYTFFHLSKCPFHAAAIWFFLSLSFSKGRQRALDPILRERERNPSFFFSLSSAKYNFFYIYLPSSPPSFPPSRPSFPPVLLFPPSSLPSFFSSLPSSPPFLPPFLPYFSFLPSFIPSPSLR
uniref:Uncharacterized protein n=1 Tax=Cacopsylla melanoneura TaxID=428564 RepID=A0A8D9E9C8_9HEMI